jgi:hypothetical protein
MFVDRSQEYNTSTQVNDILTYHKFGSTVDPLHGFTNYLNYEYASIIHEGITWFDGYTDKEWVFVDGSAGFPYYHLQKWGYLDKFYPTLWSGSNPVGEEFPGGGDEPIPPSMFGGAIWKPYQAFYTPTTRFWGSLGHPYDNGGGITPEQIKSMYVYAFPFVQGVWSMDCMMNDPRFDGWLDLQNHTQQQYSRSFGTLLSRMKYQGGFYGGEKGALNVLAIGEQGIGNLLHYLSPALNITLYGGEFIDGNLTQLGDFNQFNVIIWLGSRPNPVGNVLERIRDFVFDGGGYVEVRGSWDDVLNPVLGFDQTGAVIGSSITKDYINLDSSMISTFTNLTDYTAGSVNWISRDIEPDAGNPGTVVVNSTNGNPWLSINEYGNGRGVLCALTSRLNEIGNPPEIGKDNQKWGAPRDDFIVLLSNAILQAGKKEHFIAPWYYSHTYNKEYSWNTQLQHFIYGQPGKPLLLWVTNNGTETSFEIHLNATFFHLDPEGWIAINVENWSIATWGTGTDITINLTIPAKSWAPIYITNTTSNL